MRLMAVLVSVDEVASGMVLYVSVTVMGSGNHGEIGTMRLV